jgi:hypothetical protein
MMMENVDRPEFTLNHQLRHTAPAKRLDAHQLSTINSQLLRPAVARGKRLELKTQEERELRAIIATLARAAHYKKMTHPKPQPPPTPNPEPQPVSGHTQVFLQAYALATATLHHHALRIHASPLRFTQRHHWITIRKRSKADTCRGTAFCLHCGAETMFPLAMGRGLCLAAP